MALETLSGQGLSLGTTSHSALAQRRLGLGLLWVWVRLGSGAPVCFLCHPLLRPHLLAFVSKLWHRNHHGAKPLNPQHSTEAGRAPEASRAPEARTAWHSPVRRTPGKLPHPGGGRLKAAGSYSLTVGRSEVPNQGGQGSLPPRPWPRPGFRWLQCPLVIPGS